MVADEWGIERWQKQRFQHWEHEMSAAYSPDHGAVLPELRGERVRLRPLKTGDEIQLHLWATDAHEKWLWREETGLIAFKTFRTQLRRALVANEPHLIVEGLHSGLQIGWVYADQLSFDHHRCRMTVYVIPEARNYGAGAEAGVLFLDYLFGWIGLQKVFVEALASQRTVIQMAINIGFRIEGIFNAERRVGSHPVDVLRLAMQRTLWQEMPINDSETTACYRLPHMRRMLQMNAMLFSNTDEPQNL